MARLRLLIFGFGYAGGALARRLIHRGWAVSGVTRGEAGRAAMADLGVQPADPDPAALAETVHRAGALLIAAPPDAEGCPGLRACLPAFDAGARPVWIGYLSTTGVYGDRGGRWVFETSRLDARSMEGARRAKGEHDWLATGDHLGLTATVFRLPGIYGPGRSPFDRLREGTARRIVKPGQVFSRIHVDDLAAGLDASIRRPRAGGIYNLCDDEPAPAAEVTAHAARLLDMAPPPEEPIETARLSPMAARFYAESKRVSNARAKAELGWRPAYPTYREGLAAILAAGG
jgi:nucleoside-diphosphate-sugar epimerase